MNLNFNKQIYPKTRNMLAKEYLESNLTLLQKIKALIIALQSYKIYSKQIDDLTKAKSRLRNN